MLWSFGNILTWTEAKRLARFVAVARSEYITLGRIFRIVGIAADIAPFEHLLVRHAFVVAGNAVVAETVAATGFCNNLVGIVVQFLNAVIHFGRYLVQRIVRPVDAAIRIGRTSDQKDSGQQCEKSCFIMELLI